HLDADDAERRVGFGKSVINVGAQRVQRQTALQIPFAAGDLRAVQAARHAHLDALRAEALRVLDRASHGAAEGDALFKLLRDLLGLELRVQLRLVNLLYVDVDLTARALFDLLLELVNLRALAPDDDAGARRVDDDLQLVGGALDIDAGDASAGEARLQFALELQVFVQQVGVLALGDPVGVPRAIDAEPEPVRMNFLTHNYSSFFSVSTSMVMWLCQRRSRSARPMAAGPTPRR